MNNLLIKAENSNEVKVLMVVLIENHKRHILGHLKYIWKPRIFKHIIQHLRCWHRQKKLGIPIIEFEEILYRSK